jgi:hypothetical protein
MKNNVKIMKKSLGFLKKCLVFRSPLHWFLASCFIIGRYFNPLVIHICPLTIENATSSLGNFDWYIDFGIDKAVILTSISVILTSLVKFEI